MDSHIQMPKCVLKQFVITSGLLKNWFFYYDIEKDVITKGSPSSVNTQADYFSKFAEEELSKRIETPLGKLISILNKNLFSNNEEFILKQTHNRTIYNYLYSLLSRSPKMVENIKNGMFFGGWLTDQEIHEIATFDGLKIMQENKEFKEFSITFVVNNSEIPFVLPICGFYAFATKEEEAIIQLPITERISIRLFMNKYMDRYCHGGKIKQIYVNEEDIIKRMNSVALREQTRYNVGYIICSNKEELQRLKDLAQKE